MLLTETIMYVKNKLNSDLPCYSQYQVCTTVQTKIIFLWDVILFNLVYRY
jgi:hypothetical protein